MNAPRALVLAALAALLQACATSAPEETKYTGEIFSGGRRLPHELDRLRLAHQHAGLAGPPAMVLHAPVGAVAHAAGLADDKVGGAQPGFECQLVGIVAAVVVQVAAAGNLHQLPRERWRIVLAADAQHRLFAQVGRGRVTGPRHGAAAACRRCQQRTARGGARREFFAHDRNGGIARHQRAAQPHDLRLELRDARDLLGHHLRAAFLDPGIGPQQHGMFLHRELHGGHSR